MGEKRITDATRIGGWRKAYERELKARQRAEATLREIEKDGKNSPDLDANYLADLARAALDRARKERR